MLRYDRELLLSVSGCPLSRSHHGKPAEAKNPTRNRPHRKLWRFLAPERLPAATPERQVLVHGSTPRAAEDIHTPSQPPPRSWRLTSTARSHVSAVKRRHEAVTASTDSRPESDRKRDFDAGRRPSLACCQSKSARPRSMPVCDRTAAKSARISLFANTRRRPARYFLRAGRPRPMMLITAADHVQARARPHSPRPLAASQRNLAYLRIFFDSLSYFMSLILWWRALFR